MATIFTWNILHGGGRRIPEILLRLLEHAPDVIVLTEYRVARGGAIRGVLADHGWTHQFCTDPPENRNGLLIACRQPLTPQPEPPPPKELTGKWAMVEIPGLGFSLAAAHIPEVREGTTKTRAWTFVEGVARAKVGEAFAIVGDLNTGRSLQDEEAPMLTCSAFMGRLWTIGYRDAWRELHPDAREYSWYSHLGHGFRLDHVLLSPALASRLETAKYGHAERKDGLSDHASLTVRLTPLHVANAHDPDESAPIPGIFDLF